MNLQSYAKILRIRITAAFDKSLTFKIVLYVALHLVYLKIIFSQKMTLRN